MATDSDADRSGFEKGEVLDSTAQALAMMVYAGLAVGAGGMMLLYELGLMETGPTLLVGLLCVGLGLVAGVLGWYINPDARTVATAVEEVDDLVE